VKGDGRGSRERGEVGSRFQAEESLLLGVEGQRRFPFPSCQQTGGRPEPSVRRGEEELEELAEGRDEFRKGLLSRKGLTSSIKTRSLYSPREPSKGGSRQKP